MQNHFSIFIPSPIAFLRNEIWICLCNAHHVPIGSCPLNRNRIHDCQRDFTHACEFVFSNKNKFLRHSILSIQPHETHRTQIYSISGKQWHPIREWRREKIENLNLFPSSLYASGAYNDGERIPRTRPYWDMALRQKARFQVPPFCVSTISRRFSIQIFRNFRKAHRENCRRKLEKSPD